MRYHVITQLQFWRTKILTVWVYTALITISCNINEDVWSFSDSDVRYKELGCASIYWKGSYITNKIQKTTWQTKKERHKKPRESLSSSTHRCVRCNRESDNTHTCNFFSKEKWHFYFQIHSMFHLKCFFCCL